MEKYDKRKANISSKLHMIYTSSNNVRHHVSGGEVIAHAALIQKIEYFYCIRVNHGVILMLI